MDRSVVARLLVSGETRLMGGVRGWIPKDVLNVYLRGLKGEVLVGQEATSAVALAQVVGSASVLLSVGLGILSLVAARGAIALLLVLLTSLLASSAVWHETIFRRLSKTEVVISPGRALAFASFALIAFACGVGQAVLRAT